MKNYKKLKITTLFIILLSFINISSAANSTPFESTYEPMPQTNTLFRGANIYDGEGNEFLDTDLLIKDGKIIGKSISNSLKTLGFGKLETVFSVLYNPTLRQ